MNRRQFLQLSSGAALGLMTSACARDEATAPGALSGASGPWGRTGESALHTRLPAPAIPDGVLEVFLMGGLNPWDTFYVVPEHGDPKRSGPFAGTQWWTWQEGPESVPEIFGQCGGADRPLYTPFGRDAAGLTVNLGPWLYPLRERPDILARMRLHVMFHDFEPHEAAAPLFLGGQPRGTPRMASTGSHVQRFWQEREAGRTAPHSYVLYPGSHYVAGFNVESAFAIGTHPGRAQPLALQITADNPITHQLGRTRLGEHAGAVDAAVDHYLGRYRAAYAPGRLPQELAQLQLARAAMHHSGELAGLLTPEALATTGGSACGLDTDFDVTATGMRLAAHLLTSPVNRARYVHLVDSGLVESLDGGYDTHQYHVRDTSRNTINMCRRLVSIINEPGEADPRKLDLDRHMVLITTEMGRTPSPQVGNVRGLNHWPYGFVVATIGGPVDESRAGVVGAIGEDGRALEGTTPAELRAALLLAQGIWPFERESFVVSDVRDARDEVEAALMLRERVLGFKA